MEFFHGFCQTLGPLQQVAQFLLEHLRVEQLFAVFPFVQCLGLVQAFVALQADEWRVQQKGKRGISPYMFLNTSLSWHTKKGGKWKKNNYFYPCLNKFYLRH